MSDDLSLTQTATGGSQLTTVTKPSDHFTEMLYVSIVLMLLLFTILVSHGHNDQLAGKAMDFVYIVLGALTQASTSGAKR